MEQEILYFVYGLCTMFYAMMAFFFMHKGKDMLSRLVTALMIIILLSCIKDLAFLFGPFKDTLRNEHIITAVDMLAEPFYALILIELCNPGRVTRRLIILQELPFVLLSTAVAIWPAQILFDAEVVWSALYGLYYAVWTIREIPRYHRQMRQRFSYMENINLNWLRTILYSFFVILAVWIMCSLVISFTLDVVYMVSSMCLWIFISYFLYRHESVVNELEDSADNEETEEAPDTDDASLGKRIEHLFRDERIYLNSKLKLSDVAAAAGTNRTYVSTYLNRDCSTTFYEYVNGYRAEYAAGLLADGNMTLEAVAGEAGFNSLSTFYRVFSKIYSCTPSEYRERMNR